MRDKISEIREYFPDAWISATTSSVAVIPDKSGLHSSEIGRGNSYDEAVNEALVYCVTYKHKVAQLCQLCKKLRGDCHCAITGSEGIK